MNDPTVTMRQGLLVLVLLCPWQGCVSESRPGLPPSSPFVESIGSAGGPLAQGVAVGDVGSRSALVWFRTDGPARAQVEWFPEGRPDLVERSAVFVTGPDRDFTMTVPLGKLTAATQYRYRVLVAGPEEAAFQDTAREAGAGRFGTAADPDRSAPVTFLWSGDLGGQQRCRGERTGYPIFDAMLRKSPAFVLLLGDTIYGDDRCPSPPNAPGADFFASTLDDYRVKHRYQRGDLFLQQLLASVPVSAVWDDHEVGNNFSGPYEPLMPVGRQALMEYWPIGAPPEEPTRLYRSLRYGADLELFILDTRQYRSRNADPDGPGKTMLGAAQRAWLLEGLARSTATWKVVATSVPLSIPKAGNKMAPGIDSWARGADGTGYQTELRAIVHELMRQRIRNVVWLATDVHFVQVNAYDPDRDGAPDFYEFVCGPLSAAPGKPVPPDPALVPTTLYSEGGYQNFGLIRLDGQSLHLEILDDAGRPRFTQTFQKTGS
ncbi:MAG: alkaline phosphatase D family protein [Nitrospirota bacterium]|nr:alkaline phosphatase D family protein [Nitrospirota bacterium]